MRDVTESEGLDEFSLLRDNADDAGIEWRGAPIVRRAIVALDGRQVSAIVWGDGPAAAVLVHGGAQNAHTWDTVALALDRPLVAIDLPGHGRSDWRDDGDYGVPSLARAVAGATRALAPEVTAVIGIGLGAPVGLLAADQLGASVNRLVLIDSVSGVRRPSADDTPPSHASTRVAEFTAHHRFVTFDEMIERTLAYADGRDERAVRRGVHHNALRHADGSWSWRWDPRQRGERDYGFPETAAALDRFGGRVMLVRGERSDIVTDELVDAFRAIHRETRLATIAGAGHAVQGDRPVELASLIGSFLDER
jgi:pimeloyl-ACP methyl ester carboxylesterase